MTLWMTLIPPFGQDAASINRWVVIKRKNRNSKQIKIEIRILGYTKL